MHSIKSEGGVIMIDMNLIIAKNINIALKNIGKQQYELAEAMNCSKQIVSNILSGSRVINAAELKKIAEFCGVSVESLVALPEKTVETNVVHMFMGRVKTDEARKGIEIADMLIDMFLFHSRVHKCGVVGMTERSSL